MLYQGTSHRLCQDALQLSQRLPADMRSVRKPRGCALCLVEHPGRQFAAIPILSLIQLTLVDRLPKLALFSGDPDLLQIKRMPSIAYQSFLDLDFVGIEIMRCITTNGITRVWGIVCWNRMRKSGQ